MGLDTAINSALSGLNASQQNLSVISQNIANVNTENYTRRIAEQASLDIGGIGQGVDITGVTRKVDEFLIQAQRDQRSISNRADSISEYFDRIQLLFGKPDTPNNLNQTINEFFSSLTSLSNNPELSSLRLDTVTKGKALASKVADLAYNLQQLRYTADRDINSAVTTINNELRTLQDVNVAIERANNTGADSAPLTETRDNALKALGDLVNISTYTSSDGRVSVSTARGKGIVGSNTYELTYTPVSTVDNIINDLAFGPIQIVNTTGRAAGLSTSNTPEILVSGGTSANVTTDLISGKLKGLLEMRDIEIPRILEQLDNFAVKLRDAFNAIHNDGAGFPPATTLTGTTAVNINEYRNFSGSVRIGLVDDSGKPIPRQDGSLLPPLTLDLNKLNSGYGVGSPDMQTIVDEINQYFYYDPVLDTTSLGPLRDIKMVATSPTLGPVPNGTFSFDFELDNPSELSGSVDILGVTVNNGATGLISALPATYDFSAGTRGRTNAPLTVDFAAGSGGPYTVSVQFRVTDENGLVSIGTTDFVIDDTPADNNVRNTRYAASSVGGSAVITPAGTIQRFAQASLVDVDGNLATSTEDAFLKFGSINNKYHIVIDELDSNEGGYSSGPIIPATNKGFSHFFGLNNFFVDHPTVSGSAINMAIRDDIKINPNLVSMGEMVQSASYIKSVRVGDAYATASMEFSANPDLGDTLTINGVTFTIVAAAVTDDQITQGATLPLTLANIAAKLNAINPTTSGAVDYATYVSNGFNMLNIQSASPGYSFNTFTIHTNTATVGISINGGLASTTANGNLRGGTDKTINTTVLPPTYEIGKGSSQIADRLANLSNNILNFTAAGGLPASSNTIGGYAADIVSYSATKATDASNTLSKEKLFEDSFTSRLKASGGVNLDEELANTMLYQNSYTASARVITVTKELMDVLMDMIQ